MEMLHFFADSKESQAKANLWQSYTQGKDCMKLVQSKENVHTSYCKFKNKELFLCFA